MQKKKLINPNSGCIFERFNSPTKGRNGSGNDCKEKM